TPRNPRIHRKSFSWCGARHVGAVVVVAGGDGSRVALVGQVAQVEPGLPVVLWRGVAEGGAEGGVGVGVVGVGVVHCDPGGVLGVKAGVEAAWMVVAQLGLVVVARQAGQAV